MKTSARFLAMLLAVVMIAGAALSVSAFSDVTAGVDHATAISVLNQLGVIGGYEDGTFKPTQNVTRAEMAKLVYVLYTTFTDAGAGTVKFNDVKADNWAVGYISWCASKGIIGGYGDGNFGPSDNVTYDQALKMVAGALGYNEWDSAQWPIDVRMKTLNELNLGEDMPATVKGGDKLTRAQVAQIMYNALFAPMKETKTVNNKYVDAAGNYFYIPATENKVLALDVWNFVEETYVIVGTENFGKKATGDEEKIAIQKVGEEKVDTVELEDLGLEAYAEKTDDLINLYITTVTKDKEMLASATINGSVTDNVTLAYEKARTSITINGVKYGPENFTGANEKDDDQIRLYDDKGNEITNIKYFNDEDKLTADFTNLFDGKAYLARVIDFDGNGDADALVIAEKVAYEVTDTKTKSGVTTVTYNVLNDTKNLTIDAANVTTTLAKGDIFVGAKMGNTLYAEIVKPVTTYATRLSKDKVTLNEIGEVSFTKVSVAGVGAMTLGTGILGSDNEQVYYVYNGELIYTDAANTVSDYEFVILQEVEETDGEFNEITKQDDKAYIATLLVEEEGKLVEKEVVLNDESTVAGVKHTAAEMFAAFPAGKNEDGKREYKYTLVAAMDDDKNGAYALTIAENFDETKFEVVGAKETLKYNSKTGFMSITNGDKAIGKIVTDANSAIFYRFAKLNTASGSFKYLGKYTDSVLGDKDFSVETFGETYLAYNETTRTYTLLATILEDEIDYVTGGVDTYEKFGSLVLYAPKSSMIVPHEGENYNEYYFMDLETLTNKDAALDTETEHDDKKNPGTEEGFLYGFNPETGSYDKIDSTSVLNTVVYTTIADANEYKGNTFIYVGNDTDNAVTITDDVTIWGLSDEKDNGKYEQLEFADLQEMIELVANYNEKEPEEGQTKEKLEIRAILLKDYNKLAAEGDDQYEVVSVIVEIFEEDEDEVVYSVNDTIFKNFVVAVAE